ncbi:MAG: TIGR00725 family protein [Thermoplasmata archaeon]
MYVSVIGGDSTTCTERDCEIAVELGRGIARIGATLVSGGRGGVMEAVCKGAKMEGGTTIGILPSSDRGEKNQYVDHAVVTGIGSMRNALVVMNGDVVVAVDGGYGTLSEISLAAAYGKKILGIGTWDMDIVEMYEDVESLLIDLKKQLR